MQSKAATPQDYIDSLPEDRRAMVSAIRDTINDNLPDGFEAGMQYGMLGWFVPHSVYPDGYHCDAKQPVPYIGLANQKNKVSLYLFCVYVDSDLAQWFEQSLRDFLGKKPDMGKSCVRFKRLEDVPLDLIAETVRKMPLDAFMERYQAQIPASARKK